MAVATSISTRALSARNAVLLASVLNLVGALVTVLLFQAKVSNTIAKLVVISPGLVVVIAGLVGAIAWNLITWWWGLPSSSSHAFIGGLLGAAVASAGGFGAIRWSAFLPTLLSLVTSPVIGFFAAGLFVIGLTWVFRRAHPGPLNRSFRLLQVPAGAFVALSPRSHDAQKTMAALGLALAEAVHPGQGSVTALIALL